MTDHQVLHLLKTAGIEDARKQESSARLVLWIRSGCNVQQVPLGQYRTELQNHIKELEERKQEVLKNDFASHIITEFSLGGGQPVKMEGLKKDDQLSEDEKAEKVRLLGEIDAETRHHRGLMLALTHLQVHAEDLLPRLKPPEPPQAAPKAAAVTPDSREVWIKGVKAAALHCHAEAKRVGADDKALREVCRAFLRRYTISDDMGFTPEQLFNNVRQIRLLDILD